MLVIASGSMDSWEEYQRWRTPHKLRVDIPSDSTMKPILLSNDTDDDCEPEVAVRLRSFVCVTLLLPGRSSMSQEAKTLLPVELLLVSPNSLTARRSKGKKAQSSRNEEGNRRERERSQFASNVIVTRQHSASTDVPCSQQQHRRPLLSSKPL